MTPREEFRAYMKAVSRTSNNSGESHVSEQQMIAYCREELPEADRESVRAHLIGCDRCIALFRNVRDFLEPPRPEEEEISITETNNAWQSLLQQVQSEAPRRGNARENKVVPVDFPRPPDRKFLTPVTMAMAASLLISFGLLGWQTWRLSREQRQAQELASQSDSDQRKLEQRIAQLEQTSADQINRERDERLAAEAERDQLLAQLESSRPTPPQYVPLFSYRLSSERGSDDDLQLRFPRTATAARVRLIISKPYEFQQYAIELLDSNGKSVQRVSGVRPTGDEGNLSFPVNRARLTPGKYRMRLFGRQDNTSKQLGDYGLSVTADR